MGGLGNQLFAYAAARRLALANDAELRIDNLSGFRGDRFGRRYCLNHFGVAGTLVPPDDTFVNAGRYKRALIRRGSRLLPFNRRPYVSEESGGFDLRIVRLPFVRDVYLEGYWQDERYFSDVAAMVRGDLRFVRPHSARTASFAERIRRCNAVSVHVRRLEYAHRLDPAYYRNAAACVSSRVDRPELFVFADDPAWARDNLRFESPTTFVAPDPEDVDGYDDLWLMTQCQHFIVANSTFSWWGAWLGEKPRSLTVCPHPSTLPGHADFFPKRWVQA